jgi:integrase
VFPTSIGSVEYYENLVRGVLWPSQEAAGVVDGKGEPKYGMHALLHFYGSWCINRRRDGGLELPPKTVQARLGDASIVMTWTSSATCSRAATTVRELAAAARALFAT